MENLSKNKSHNQKYFSVIDFGFAGILLIWIKEVENKFWQCRSSKQWSPGKTLQWPLVVAAAISVSTTKPLSAPSLIYETSPRICSCHKFCDLNLVNIWNVAAVLKKQCQLYKKFIFSTSNVSIHVLPSKFPTRIKFFAFAK